MPNYMIIFASDSIAVVKNNEFEHIKLRVAWPTFDSVMHKCEHKFQCHDVPQCVKSSVHKWPIEDDEKDFESKRRRFFFFVSRRTERRSLWIRIRKESMKAEERKRHKSKWDAINSYTCLFFKTIRPNYQRNIYLPRAATTTGSSQTQNYETKKAEKI